MEGEFNLILNKDETIIANYKPNKFKFYLSSLVVMFFMYAFIITFFILSFVIPDENGEKMSLVAFVIAMSIVFVAIICHLVLTYMAYKKRVYCVTNQRLIIKCGVIGVDFRSLDLKYIGAVDVYVSFLDKLVRKNTGTIRFGSMSAPINSNMQFDFSHINKPYELYQSIKQIIDENKI